SARPACFTTSWYQEGKSSDCVGSAMARQDTGRFPRAAEAVRTFSADDGGPWKTYRDERFRAADPRCETGDTRVDDEGASPHNLPTMSTAGTIRRWWWLDRPAPARVRR